MPKWKEVSEGSRGETLWPGKVRKSLWFQALFKLLVAWQLPVILQSFWAEIYNIYIFTLIKVLQSPRKQTLLDVSYFWMYSGGSLCMSVLFVFTSQEWLKAQCASVYSGGEALAPRKSRERDCPSASTPTHAAESSDSVWETDGCPNPATSFLSFRK